jgi:hypothetical protein
MMNIITGENVTTTEPDETVSLRAAKVAIAAYLDISSLEGLGNGRKFGDNDLHEQPELEDYALAYLREYTGDFEYMRDMQHDYGKHGSLTLPKVRGVLNCLLAQVAYEARNRKPTQPLFDEFGNDLPLVVEEVITIAAPVEVKAGRYCTINPDTGKRHFFQVDAPVEGKWKGYTFLKEIHIGGSDNGERSIRDRDERTTILATIAADDEALARYGRETGTCGVCHRTLTDPESVALGIGPICRGK